MLSQTERIRAELLQIELALTELTGLASRWNGSVVLVPNATFRGLKPFDCAIYLNASLAESSVRWRTLIHEALHAFSVDYNMMDYDAFQGWEEGVVEALQRYWRPIILARLDIGVDETLFAEGDRTHLFNHYISALENIRLVFEQETQAFYLELLHTPLKERYSSLLQRAVKLGREERRRTNNNGTIRSEAPRRDC